MADNLSVIFCGKNFQRGGYRQSFSFLWGIMEKVIVLIVYADVLVFLNTLVDYFLLSASAKLTGERLKTLRVVLASLFGGISSLYIVLPDQDIIIEFLYKLSVAFLLSAVCYKFRSIKQYLKNTAVFFLVTCAYAGVMFALWVIFRPYGMVINNSVVYFHISPTVLVLCTVVGYLVFWVLWRIFGKTSPIAERCEVTVFADNNSVKLSAISDSGNSIEDVFEKSDVIIANKREVEMLFGSTDYARNPELQKRYRILPCSTVLGYDTLDGFRCDSATVSYGNRQTVLEKPLLAVSKVGLNDDYNAIVNPKILR